MPPEGIVKLGLTAVSDAQHGGFATGWSPVSCGLTTHGGRPDQTRDRRAFRQLDNAALAHTVRNPTEAAYARSDLFERRRRLMDDWAAYLSGPHGVRPTPAAIGSTSAH